MEYRLTMLPLGESSVPGAKLYWMEFNKLSVWEPIILCMAVIRGNGLTID